MLKLEEAGIIQGYRIEVDYEKTGYALKAFITFTAHSGKFIPFLNYIAKLDEVLECHRVTGNYCIFLKVVVENSGHLQELLTAHDGVWRNNHVHYSFQPDHAPDFYQARKQGLKEKVTL